MKGLLALQIKSYFMYQDADVLILFEVVLTKESMGIDRIVEEPSMTIRGTAVFFPLKATPVVRNAAVSPLSCKF